MKLFTSSHTLVLLAALLTTDLVARDVMVLTQPSGARVEITNLGNTRIREGSVYTSPATIDFRRRSEIYELRITKDGYAPEVITYDYNADRRRRTLEIELQPLVRAESFLIQTEPEGATVSLGGRVLGQTPLKTTLRFERAGKDAPWPALALDFTLEDYAPAQLEVEAEAAEQMNPVVLDRLREVRSFDVRAETDEGALLGAQLEVDGKSVGVSPGTLEVVFTRPDANQPWSTHTLKAYIDQEYQPRTVTLDRESDARQTLTLTPVTEVLVLRNFPTVEQTPRGPRVGVDATRQVGTLDVRDISSPATDLRPITNFSRDQQIPQWVNSFCLTPDGQQVIYSVTETTQDGRLFSNLFIKAANDLSFAFSQLTRGERFWDTRPTMSKEQGSNLVVFQSNRGPIDSWDISSFRLRDGRLVGGIQQLTRDERLNYNPFITSESQPVYFTSSETFPRAQGFLSTVQPDGSRYTNLMEVGSMVSRAQTGRTFFVRPSEGNGKLQIYSVTAEGLQFSSVINDMQFTQADCFSPAINPEGNRLLFVSNYAQDEQGRYNNNLFILDLDTGGIQQLTDNASDDLQPAWSPNEPGVLYFLSNRGGQYNLWRMKVVGLN